MWRDALPVDEPLSAHGLLAAAEADLAAAELEAEGAGGWGGEEALGRRERDAVREEEGLRDDVGRELAVPDSEALPLPLSDADALADELKLAEGLEDAVALPEGDSDADAAHVTLSAPRRAPGTPASLAAASGPASPAPHVTASTATPYTPTGLSGVVDPMASE